MIKRIHPSRPAKALTLAAALLLSAMPATAQMQNMPHGHGQHGQAGEAREAEGVGKIRAVDRANRQLSLHHEPMPALGWPAMTMSFPLDEGVSLEGLREGQQVRFHVRMEADGSYRITRIE